MNTILKDKVIERNEIKQIQCVEFGILSEQEIIAQSVAEITKNRLFSAKTKDAMDGTLYDYRMGPLDPNDICPTCDMTSKYCPGHFGHIRLNIKIVHPLFYRKVLNFLRCFCFQCSNLLFTDEHLDLW
jgi:DNA-directed RNA polymerase beta' subunit